MRGLWCLPGLFDSQKSRRGEPYGTASNIGSAEELGNDGLYFRSGQRLVESVLYREGHAVAEAPQNLSGLENRRVAIQSPADH